MFPKLSSATPVGKFRRASVAGPPSPLPLAGVPPPAIVVNVLGGFPGIHLNTLLLMSVTITAPDGVAATPQGSVSGDPAMTVVSSPLAATRRTLFVEYSAMKKDPGALGSHATPTGSASVDDVACAPSVEGPELPH
jgi:hypothetical protein